MALKIKWIHRERGTTQRQQKKILKLLINQVITYVFVMMIIK